MYRCLARRTEESSIRLRAGTGPLKRFVFGVLALVLSGGCDATQETALGSDIGIMDDAEEAVAARTGGMSPSLLKAHGFKLPWATNAKFSVTQYPHGTSVIGRHAIDFGLPRGTAVTAMKSGVISVMVESNADYPAGTRCEQKSCNVKTNFMIIRHGDGTESSYLHLKQGSPGALGLGLGDYVCQGQKIAEVGHNGFTTGPHLHISVQAEGSVNWSDMWTRPTVQILFDELAPKTVLSGGMYSSQNQSSDNCTATPPKSTACSMAADGMYCGTALPSYEGATSDLVQCRNGQVVSTLPCDNGCANDGTASCITGQKSACTDMTDGDYCGYTLSRYYKDGNIVVSCRGGAVISEIPCASGCTVDKGGDRCQAGGTSPCQMHSDGTYCGSRLLGYGTSNDLVTCAGGVVVSSSPCNYGCQANPPGAYDQCKMPPATPCSGKADSKYCGALLSGYTGMVTDLVECTGGSIRSVSACGYGCMDNPPGTPDTCKSPPSPTPCSGKVNGKYCGSTLTGYTGASSDLVTCTGGAVSASMPCTFGCQVNPPGTNDQCKASPTPMPCSGKVNGKYCGNSLTGYTGAPSDLVTCTGGAVSASMPCTFGCQVNPPGTNDQCKASPTPMPCSGKVNGKYCGSTLTGYTGVPSDLVTCTGGAVSASMPCTFGCQVNPPGTNDQCKASPAPMPCSGKINGKYCGSTLTGYAGAPSDLVTCTSGAISASMSCPRGCRINPPGTNDACNP